MGNMTHGLTTTTAIGTKGWKVAKYAQQVLPVKHQQDKRLLLVGDRSDRREETPAREVKKECPTEKSKELAEQHEEATLERRNVIKAECYGEDIAHERQPCEQRKPDTPTVDAVAL